MLSRTIVLCAFAFAFAELLVIFTRTSWIGFLGYTPEWVNAGLYVVSPLVAGAAAFVARGYFTPEVVSITGARTVTGALYAAICAWLRILLIAVAVHLAAFTVALGVTVSFGSSGTLPWEPFVLAMAPLSMACSIGVALSALFPHAWSAVLAILVTYAMWYLAVTTGSVLPVDIGGATISLAGLRYRPEAVLAAVLAAGVVTAVFLTIAAAAVRMQSFAWGVALFTVAALCLVIAGPAIGSRMSIERFAARGETAIVCEGSAPRVCLTADHSTRLGEVAQEIRSASRLLVGVGIDMSDVVLHEEFADRRPGVGGVLLLSFGQLNGITTGETDYALALMRPRDCTDYHATQPTAQGERLLETAHALSEWIAARSVGADPVLTDDHVRQLYEGLMTCSVPEGLLKSVRTL